MRPLVVIALAALLASLPRPAAAQTARSDAGIRAAVALELAARVTDPGPSPAPAARLPAARFAGPPQDRSKREAIGLTLMLIGTAVAVGGARTSGGAHTPLLVVGVLVGAYGFYLFQQ